MALHKRGQLGAEAMRTLLACFAQSGLAVAAFCRREGISPQCDNCGYAKLRITAIPGSFVGQSSVPNTSGLFKV